LADKDLAILQARETETSKEAEGGFGILKPSRGYWVRMLSAVAIAVISFSTGAWVWNALSAYQPPARAWTIPLSQIEGTTPTLGQKVDLIKFEDNKPVTIGSGVIESYTTEGKTSAIAVVKDAILRDASIDRVNDAKRLQTQSQTTQSQTQTSQDSDVVFSAAVGNPIAIPKFQLIYLQAAAATLVFLAGLYLIYRFVGNKPQSVDFLIATDEEMRKVNWSTRKIIVDSTYVVIAATFLIAAYIFLADLGLKQILLNQFVSR
jgi:preprotein translocase SecE subunit